MKRRDLKNEVIKKLFSCLGFCIIITVMVGAPVLAQPISNEYVESHSTIQGIVDISNIKLGEKVILPDGAILTPISKDEYISRLAKEKNISIKEAYEMDSKNSKNHLMKSGTTYYYNYSKIFTYSENSDFKAELIATIEIWNSGSFRQIENVLSVGSKKAAGVYTYRWEEVDAYSNPTKNSDEFPTRSVVLGANGYFEVTTTESIDLSIDLPGFSGGVSSSDEYVYTSEAVFLLGSLDVYETSED